MWAQSPAVEELEIGKERVVEVGLKVISTVELQSGLVSMMRETAIRMGESKDGKANPSPHC